MSNLAVLVFFYKCMDFLLKGLHDHFFVPELDEVRFCKQSWDVRMNGLEDCGSQGSGR